MGGINWWKSRENVCGLLAGAAKYATPPNVGEKTFANSYKTLKFVKVESFEVTESCWIERGYIDVPFTE